MLQQYLMQQEEIILGWGFFVPLAMMIVLILLAARIWVVIGIGSFAMLYIHGCPSAYAAWRGAVRRDRFIRIDCGAFVYSYRRHPCANRFVR